MGMIGERLRPRMSNAITTADLSGPVGSVRATYMPAFSSSNVTAGRAYLVPIVIPRASKITTLFTYKTSVTDDLDLGLYDHLGNRVVSTGVLSTAASTVDYRDVTPVTVNPGKYYLAYVSLTATAVMRIISSPTMKLMGAYSSASAIPLPETVILDTNSTFIPLIGLLAEVPNG